MSDCDEDDVDEEVDVVEEREEADLLRHNLRGGDAVDRSDAAFRDDEDDDDDVHLTPAAPSSSSVTAAASRSAGVAVVGAADLHRGVVDNQNTGASLSLLNGRSSAGSSADSPTAPRSPRETPPGVQSAPENLTMTSSSNHGPGLAAPTNTNNGNNNNNNHNSGVPLTPPRPSSHNSAATPPSSHLPLAALSALHPHHLMTAYAASVSAAAAAAASNGAGATSASFPSPPELPLPHHLPQHHLQHPPSSNASPRDPREALLHHHQRMQV